MLSATPHKSERRQSLRPVVVAPRPPNAWRPYGFVLLSLAGVFVLNAVFSPYMQGRAPLAGITIPVMLGACLGGFRVGVVATLMALAVGYYMAVFRWGGQMDDYQKLQVVMFLIVGFTISWLGERHQKAQAKLAQIAVATDKRKDDFLAMLGHELRNPLSGISSAARLLRHPALAPRGMAESANIIHRQVAHMEHLINDLLDVSRVTRGQVLIDKVPVDIVQVMHAAVEQVRALIEHRQHHLVMNLPAAPVWVLGDTTRLVQVVTNLLVNAARYTPDKGVLTLTLAMSLTEKQVQLSVQDNGVGIAAELAERVFEIFVQAKRSTDGVMGGLGLGLSLVKSMVEAHGGQVSVYSAGLGHGSTFRVTLPLSATVQKGMGPSDLSPAEPLLQAASEVKSLDILLVDDNRDAADPLAMLLEFEGHRVLVAYSGQEALRQAEQQRFEVAILDIGLPDMDGYTLARRLRAMPQQSAVRLVAVTGYGTAEDKARAHDAGFDQHITKPIDCDLLLDELQQESQPASPSASVSRPVCTH